MIYIPVYTTVSGNGTNATYTLKGFAAFVITGYHLPGLSRDGLGDRQDPVQRQRLLHQRFLHPWTRHRRPAASAAPNLGANIIKLTG